ncbi:hypothetical protein SNK04_013788 [Fusarium graminearum]
MNVDADTPATEPDTTPTDLTTDALSALDAGIAAADAEEAPAAEPTPADTTPQADAGTPPADDPNAAPPADGQPRPSRRKVHRPPMASRLQLPMRSPSRTQKPRPRSPRWA